MQNIVLIHGWGGSKYSMEGLSKALNKLGYKTYIFELPGHGETPEMSSPWGMEDFAKWTLDKIKALNLENPILIGHSFGGRIILELHSSKLLITGKMVLIDISGIRPKNSFKKLIGKTASKLPFKNKLRNLGYKYIIREKDYLNLSGNLKETFKIINEAHYDEKLDRIDSECLIIWGRDDKITPLWMGKKLNEKLRRSKLEILEGTHSLPLKKPEEVAKLIDKFIK